MNLAPACESREDLTPHFGAGTVQLVCATLMNHMSITNQGMVVYYGNWALQLLVGIPCFIPLILICIPETRSYEVICLAICFGPFGLLLPITRRIVINGQTKTLCVAYYYFLIPVWRKQTQYAELPGLYISRRHIESADSPMTIYQVVLEPEAHMKISVGWFTDEAEARLQADFVAGYLLGHLTPELPTTDN